MQWLTPKQTLKLLAMPWPKVLKLLATLLLKVLKLLATQWLKALPKSKLPSKAKLKKLLSNSRAFEAIRKEGRCREAPPFFYAWPK